MPGSQKVQKTVFAGVNDGCVAKGLLNAGAQGPGSERERSLGKVRGQEKGGWERGPAGAVGGGTLILTGLPPSPTGGFGKTEQAAKAWLEILQPTLLGTQSWRAEAGRGKRARPRGGQGLFWVWGPRGQVPGEGVPGAVSLQSASPFFSFPPSSPPSSPSPAPVLQIAGRLNSLRASLVDSEVVTLGGREGGRDSGPHSHHCLTPCGPDCNLGIWAGQSLGGLAASYSRRDAQNPAPESGVVRPILLPNLNCLRSRHPSPVCLSLHSLATLPPPLVVTKVPARRKAAENPEVWLLRLPQHSESPVRPSAGDHNPCLFCLQGAPSPFCGGGSPPEAGNASLRQLRLGQGPE
ncbi:uncharacterized protein LOC123857751 [Mirounga angustirostris]|uniref:uncharacterized protein LOC123857751 n=1 Tax=Mirounga angustirostris TaxID=9716 RepID=UPI00313B5F88